MKQVFIIFVNIIVMLNAQTEVVTLSEKVGTEIDVHENRFYRIFPKEKGFINAQLIKVSDSQYKVVIVKTVKKKKTEVIRIISQKEILRLKKEIDKKPIFTEKAKISMYAGMDFLRGEKIINQIETPQYAIIKYSGKKHLKGTLFKIDNNVLYMQTPSTIEKIDLVDIDRISYRTNLGQYEKYRYYFYALTGVAGLRIANYYNLQRPVTFNDYGFKRNDIVVYRHLLGIMVGLLFSSEVFDAISTLLTSSDTIILSELEYEEENFK